MKDFNKTNRGVTIHIRIRDVDQHTLGKFNISPAAFDEVSKLITKKFGGGPQF